MSIIRSYAISKVSLQIECEDKRLSKRLIDAFDDYFLLSRDISVTCFHIITLRFSNNNTSFKIPEAAQELSVSSSLSVLKDEDFYYLLKGNSVIKIDLLNSRGIGFMDSVFWKSPMKLKQEYFKLSLLWLLRRYGLYALHANGLVKNYGGVLILGGSGSGKSTTALSLIRQGWDYLSDDVILFRDSLEGIEALAFQNGFSFDPILANRYPELNKPFKETSLDGQKRILDIRSLYTDRFVPECIPKVLLFPQIVPQHKSRLIPIDKTRAFIMLVEGSCGIMIDKELVNKQVRALKKLLYQTNSYQLLLGHDLYEEPEKITEILSEVDSHDL